MFQSYLHAFDSIKSVFGSQEHTGGNNLLQIHRSKCQLIPVRRLRSTYPQFTISFPSVYTSSKQVPPPVSLADTTCSAAKPELGGYPEPHPLSTPPAAVSQSPGPGQVCCLIILHASHFAPASVWLLLQHLYHSGSGFIIFV